MGKVRTKTVKKTARFLLERYFSSLTLDFQVNKKLCDEVALIPSKNLRNKIAGFVTHLVKRISKGTIQGISIRLQENQIEQRNEQKELENFLQNIELIKVDKYTKIMLRSLLNMEEWN